MRQCADLDDRRVTGAVPVTARSPALAEAGAVAASGAPRANDAYTVEPIAARPVIAFVWDRFGPYHVDRCEACAEALGDKFAIVGIEIASFDDIYSWEKSRSGEEFRKITLFPSRQRQSVSQFRCFSRLLAACLRLRVQYAFLCNYEDPVIFAVAAVMRLLGRPVVVMQDSKFDDKQRRLPWEVLKWCLYLPYNGALAGSPRTASYLEFLGMPRSRIFVGYDTVSVSRMRELAGAPPAPDGAPHSQRHFTVIARFVPKKNLGLALDAYARYAAECPGQPREIHFCGSGELDQELRLQAERLALPGIRFRGFLQEEGVARVLASSLALILPSVEEQYGLVVNEAVALGVPVLLSDNCGARDVLVRTGVNGYVFEPDSPAGLAHFMTLLDRDPAEWARLARKCRLFETAADTATFAGTVERAIESFRRGPVREEVRR